jgi:hypothetical protein
MYRCLNCKAYFHETDDLNDHIDEVHNTDYGKIETPELHCSKCGILESDTEFNSLLDFEVITRNSEEGFSDVLMWLCDDCAQPMITALKDLGFKNHDHGGTAFLQDDDCPDGYEKCKKQPEYGVYVVQ